MVRAGTGLLAPFTAGAARSERLLFTVGREHRRHPSLGSGSHFYAFRVFGMPSAAALAMTAALLHTFNHSLFKSLLVLSARAPCCRRRANATWNIWGASLAICPHGFRISRRLRRHTALPPFNGFVSEWLTFQAILLSPELSSWMLKILAPAVGALLALSAALAAACFAKAFGIAFLGRPRTDAARHARETNRFARAAMFALAALCLVAGIFPRTLGGGILSPAVSNAVGSQCRTRPGTRGFQSRRSRKAAVPTRAARVPVYRHLRFLAASVIHRFASDALRRRPAWDCGFRPQSCDAIHGGELCAAIPPRVRRSSVRNT